MKLFQDGTFIDYCKWYGGDCGDCFKLEDGKFPECFEGIPGEPRPDVYCHECSKAGGASMPIYHLPPICKAQSERG